MSGEGAVAQCNERATGKEMLYRERGGWGGSPDRSVDRSEGVGVK